LRATEQPQLCQRLVKNSAIYPLLLFAHLSKETYWSIVPNKLPLFEIGSLSGYK
jgi:hypothetical protein